MSAERVAARAALFRLARGGDRALTSHAAPHRLPLEPDRGDWLALAPFATHVRGELDALLAGHRDLAFRVEAPLTFVDRLDLLRAARGLGPFSVQRFEGPPQVIWIVGKQRLGASPWDAWVRALAQQILTPLHTLYDFAAVELGAITEFDDAPPSDDDLPDLAWLVCVSPPAPGAVIELTREGIDVGGVMFALRGGNGCLRGAAIVNGVAVMAHDLVDNDRVAIGGLDYVYKTVR